MRYSNAEDHILLLMLPCAIALVGFVNQSANRSQLLALSATTAIVEPGDPDYLVTVTAKRLPADCKIGGPQQGSAKCQALIAQNARIDMGPAKPQFASAPTASQPSLSSLLK